MWSFSAFSDAFRAFSGLSLGAFSVLSGLSHFSGLSQGFFKAFAGSSRAVVQGVFQDAPTSQALFCGVGRKADAGA